MDPTVLEGLLKAIRDAVSGHRRSENDVALPVFDPATNDNGAESWCHNIEELAREFGWSSIATVARAGKALKGSAVIWFESWEPSQGRTWENFRSDLTDLYPEKRNLSEKLTKAVVYNSDSADTYCEYAREKVRLLRNTKISFTEPQLIELICGSITDVNVRMASFNSNVKTTSEIISLFSSYVKPKKRPSEQNDTDKSVENKTKRPKIEFGNYNASEKKCYICGKTGHTKLYCRRNTSHPPEIKKSNNVEVKISEKSCNICKKIGHDESICWYRARAGLEKTQTSSESNFLDKRS